MIRESGDLLFWGKSLQARANAWEATMTAVLRPRMRTISLSFLFFVLSSFFFVLPVEAAGLSGKIVDPDGRGVANAEVIVSGAAAPLRTHTDSEGRFNLPSLDAGRYSVIATAPGLVSDAQSIEVTASPATLDIALHLTAINETLVVSAAQVDQPLSRTPDSVTVIPGAEIDAKQQFTLAA